MTPLSESQKAFYVELGLRIVAARKSAGISQTELAVKLGMSSGNLSHVEKGDQRLLANVLADIAEHLRVSVLDLLPPRYGGAVAGILTKQQQQVLGGLADYMVGVAVESKRST